MQADEPSFANNIVRAALNQKFLVVIGALLLVGVGSWSFTRLPVDAYPDLSPPMVEITTQWPGHAAEEVERLVTVPIETEMNGVERVKVVRSISLYGLSDVIMTFRDGTDPYFARQSVFEHLPDATMPNGVGASVAPLFSPSGLVYRYVLDGPDRSPMELKVINGWILTKAFKSVPGVAVHGEPRRSERCSIRCSSILQSSRAYGLLLISDVANALGSNNDNSGGGFYSEGGQFYVRGLARRPRRRKSATSSSRPRRTASPCS